MNLAIKEDGKRKRKFTLHSQGIDWEFDTPQEVLAFVKAEPDREYTIYLGDSVSLSSAEVEQISVNWRR